MSLAAATPPPVAADTHCAHCGLGVPEALRDESADLQFCCAGCEVAYETIHGCGLDDYYAYRDRTATQAQAATAAQTHYAAYDSQVFQDRHTTTTSGGGRSVELRLEGVHCAACVWLIEKLPRVVPGVIEARLSLGSSRARVVWNPDETPLSKIAAALDRLGYTPHPARDLASNQSRDAADRKRLVHVAIAGALAGNSMLMAVALYAGAFEGIEAQFEQLFRWLSLALGVTSLAWPGATFFRGAWTACRAGIANLDQPIALALGVGAAAGVVNVILNRGDVYFDSLSVLVFLLLIGRFLQARQQRWAEEAIGLMLSITPDTARVVRDSGLIEEPIEAIAPGDVLEVRSGELFPVDGAVAHGASAMDQSILTGESKPVRVTIGDPVYAGALNTKSTLRVTTEAVGPDSRAGKLVRLVEDGLAEKPPIVQLADRFAGWFVLIVAGFALINLSMWWAMSGLGPAIDSTVALLIVACPCALGLATPLTMAIAIGRGSKLGMLIKSAAVLEHLASVRPSHQGTAYLDKTGTLTSGRLQVVQWTGEEWLKPYVAALEEESPHPIGKALTAELTGSHADATTVTLSDRVERHGSGVTAECSSGSLLIGSIDFALSEGCEAATEMLEAIDLAHRSAHTVVVVAVDGAILAVVELTDSLQPEALEGVEWLRRTGWRPAILSGDSIEPVARVADRLNIPPDSVHARISPEDKLAAVRRATAALDGPVMMVGDGVNDAAALAAADIGGGGSRRGRSVPRRRRRLPHRPWGWGTDRSGPARQADHAGRASEPGDLTGL